MMSDGIGPPYQKPHVGPGIIGYRADIGPAEVAKYRDAEEEDRE
jgi:hypothetical protein